jgi:pilus assembly protein CpaC
MIQLSPLGRTVRRAAAIAATILAIGGGAAWSAPAQTRPVDPLATGAADDGRPMTVELNKSRLIDLPDDVAEVVISNPAVIEAVVRTPRRVHLLGQQIGQTSAVFIGRGGARLLTLDIAVQRDLTPVATLIRRLVPGAKVRLEAVNDNIVLSGTAPNPLDATRVADIASRFTAKREQVLNLLNVEAKEQVLLRVTVAEMNRTVIKRLGVDIREALTSGNIAIAKIAANSFPVTGGLVGSTLLGAAGNASTLAPSGTSAIAGWSTRNNSIDAIVQMLERKGLARTLAEPNLTSISGETAEFLAGGEYPVPIASEKEQITIAFKPFGVKLSFTPVVLSEGRISLKVATEVSELTSEGAVVVNSISIPALKVRRANSTIELPSGGALVMAGMISSQTRKNVEGLPGVRDLPVLGALFRSDDFIRSETEMVVIVTPYLVDTAARSALKLPGDDIAALAADTDAGAGDAVALSSAPVGQASPADKGFGFIID